MTLDKKTKKGMGNGDEGLCKKLYFKKSLNISTEEIMDISKKRGR